MKKFLSDYGFTILAAIVVITLITFGSPIGSTIQKQTANIVQSLGKVANNDLNKIDDSAPLIDLTNINKSGVVGDFSRKGNLVTINDTQYRVLDVNGTQVKVMSMASVGSSRFNSSSVTTSFAGTDGQKYADSALDQAMTTYYNSLPAAIKTAIVPQTIKQSMYLSPNQTATANRKGEVTVGTRYVYALDVDDVIEYLGEGYTSDDLMKMFFEVDTSTVLDRGIWLRSAYFSHSLNAFRVYVNYRMLQCNFFTSFNEVRPAFVLDLSLLS